MLRNVAFALALLAAASPEARAAAQPSAVDLTCEYLVNPQGIDAVPSRLSWRIEPADIDERGTRQTAYRVLVASAPEILAKDQGDLWDSGEVASPRSVNVTYAGKALRSGQPCYWKVCVRDQADRWSMFSQAARFSIGLLKPEDWKAKWIGGDQVFVPSKEKKFPPEDNSVPDPWLRKSFDLAAVPRRATVYVASIGYHELYVNGKPADDRVLSPCATDYTKRARYVTYDITSLLRPGKNTLAFWLGASWSIFPNYATDDRPRTPVVLAQAEIEQADGVRKLIVTDSSWKYHASPNTLVGTWSFMNHGGELYDASKEVPDWNQPNCDDSSWQPAKVYEFDRQLTAEMVEPTRRLKEIRPVKVEAVRMTKPKPWIDGCEPIGPGEPASGLWRIDMGVNFAGFVEVAVTAKPGEKVEFLFSEQPEIAMTHRIRSAIIVGPSGKATFRNRFNYMSGRWILVRGAAQKPLLDEIRGWSLRTDFRPIGAFECSNKLLNDIHNTTMWTFENLTIGGYVVDCPQRERFGYGGDAHATIDTAMTHYRLGAFYTKWAEDWRDVQRDDGWIPNTAPTYFGAGGPAWGAFTVTLPWEIYCRYGDTRALAAQYDSINRWLAFLDKNSEGNLLNPKAAPWNNSGSRFIADHRWPAQQRSKVATPYMVCFNSCFWAFNLETAAKIADVLGKKQDAAAWRKQADAVCKAVQAKFFTADNGYTDSLQWQLAAPLLFGATPEANRPAVWKRLEEQIFVHDKSHFGGGITGGYVITKLLTEAQRPDLMYVMATQEDYPGWGFMLKSGATTIWEGWEDDQASKLHSSYLFVGGWCIQGLGGIQSDPQRPGMQSFVVRPATEVARNGLRWVRARSESLYGPIESRWNVDGGQMKVEVAVPPNSTCRLLLDADVAGVQESGKPLSTAPGVKVEGRAGNRLVLVLEPGRYSFATKAQ